MRRVRRDLALEFRPNLAGRRTPVGPERTAHGDYHLRVWAPRTGSLAVECLAPDGAISGPVPLESEPNGYFSGIVPGLGPGVRYRLRTDDGRYPDPASRWQPEGPHGPSGIFESQFEWTDAGWQGRPTEELVIYELHLGTFSAEGTWAGAARELPELARLGITMLEIMPIAEFPGRFGWGYDGVGLFAPCHLYGTPDEARAFVDRAHGLGIAVILDVVYNHLGPDGNHLAQFSPDYFSPRYRCEWGQALNFDGPNAQPVREFFLSNAQYWIEEFHFDGLRFDATQQIFDESPRHILAELSDRARAAAPHRRLFLVAENETQQSRLVRPRESGGHGFDALWNDDFHHAARVAATGRREAYYLDYLGRAQEFVSLAKRGFLFQGQWNRWQGQRRGSPTAGLSPRNFVLFLQNHDQVANSLRGQRLQELTSPALYRALTGMWLLFPGIPLFFQGQEFAASAPFLYFADLSGDLRPIVAQGRHGFLRQFRSVSAAQPDQPLDVPHEPATFARCRLDFAERDSHAPLYRLHQDLLRLRRTDPAIAAGGPVDGAVLREDAFVLRYSHAEGDRLLLVNLGADHFLNPAPEPLLAPPEGKGWRMVWSSEAPAYLGSGTPDVETTSNWILPAHCTVLLAPDDPRDLPAAKLSEKD